MSATATPFRVGQVWTKNKNGLTVFTYFCEWSQDAESFFYTKVYGGMLLETSRRDESKAIGPKGWTYAKLESEMGRFLTKDETGRSEALWSKDEISEELNKRRKQQLEGLKAISK